MKTPSQAFAEIEALAADFHKKHASVSEDEAFNWLYRAYNMGTAVHLPLLEMLTRPSPKLPPLSIWDRLGAWMVGE